MNFNWKFLIIGLGISAMVWARYFLNPSAEKFYTLGFAGAFLALTAIMTGFVYVVLLILFGNPIQK